MQPTRRHLLEATALGAAAALTGCKSLAAGAAPAAGRLRQSVAGWCFLNQGPRWDVATLVKTAAEFGCHAVELVDPEHWDLVRQHGLICAATRSHTFVRGMCQRGHWDECHAQLRSAIETTGAAGFPNVMTFTGMADTSTEPGGGVVTLEEGIENCVAGYRQIVAEAERAGVTMVLEPLNTRDSTPMKGHPGYLGAHLDTCLEIVRRVNSPALRILFDVYHVQIMDGDLVRRLRENLEWIGHVQMAGCPGRGPLDGSQEIHYPAVMRALAELGYDGYVGHEWIATGDAHEQLRRSIAACAV